MSKAVFCIARTEAQAEEIVQNLRRTGFEKDDISVLFPDKSGSLHFAHAQHSKAPEGAAAGVGTGGILGGAFGWLAGAGLLSLPGLGPFIAAGPLLAAIGGLGIGATAGGIAGALVGLGIPEFEAKRFEGQIEKGNILISVHSENAQKTRKAKEVFSEAGGEHIAVARETHIPRKGKR